MNRRQLSRLLKRNLGIAASYTCSRQGPDPRSISLNPISMGALAMSLSLPRNGIVVFPMAVTLPLQNLLSSVSACCKSWAHVVYVRRFHSDFKDFEALKSDA